MPCVSVGFTGAGGCGPFCARAGVANVTPAKIVVASNDPLKVLFDIMFPFRMRPLRTAYLLPDRPAQMFISYVEQ